MFLVGFGLVMIFSTSSYKSTLNFGNPYHWLIRQCFAVGVGAVFMAALTWFDYRILNAKIIAYGCYGLSVALLIIVLFIGAAKKELCAGSLSEDSSSSLPKSQKFSL